MKKTIIILLLTAFLGAGKASAQFNATAVTDSLSREIGQIYGMNVAQIYKDQAQKDIFIGAVKQVLAAKDESYIEGLSLALEYLKQEGKMKDDSNVTLNRAEFVNSLTTAINDNAPFNQMAMMQLPQDIKRHVQLLEENNPVVIANTKAGEEYAAQKIANEGFTKTETGLVYKIVEQGKSMLHFVDGDAVQLKYKGTHIDGTVFDESKDTVTMALNRVVPGFKEALKLMVPGTKMIAIIPGNLGYGKKGIKDRQTGETKIGPNETLVFEITAYGLAPGKKQEVQQKVAKAAQETFQTEAAKQKIKKK